MWINFLSKNISKMSLYWKDDILTALDIHAENIDVMEYMWESLGNELRGFVERYWDVARIVALQLLDSHKSLIEIIDMADKLREEKRKEHDRLDNLDDDWSELFDFHWHQV